MNTRGSEMQDPDIITYDREELAIEVVLAQISMPGSDRRIKTSVRRVVARRILGRLAR